MWHLIQHWLATHTGSLNTPGTPPIYYFWSGVAGSFLVNIITFLLIFYVHNTCHDSRRCLRWAKYPAAGGVFKLCRHHHPDLKGERPHRELIRRMHAEHKARTAPQQDLGRVAADMTAEAGRIVAAVEKKLGRPGEGSRM